MTSADTLLPCPFCGGGAAYDFDNTMVAPYGHMLTCNRCATTSGSSPSKEHAIAAWNRRTAPATDAGEREAVARAMFGRASDAEEMIAACNPIGEPCDYPAWMIEQPSADRIISALAPYRATERATEYARGLADGVKQSEAAIVDWLRSLPHYANLANQIERGEHDTGKEG